MIQVQITISNLLLNSDRLLNTIIFIFESSNVGANCTALAVAILISIVHDQVITQFWHGLLCLFLGFLFLLFSCFFFLIGSLRANSLLNTIILITVAIIFILRSSIVFLNYVHLNVILIRQDVFIRSFLILFLFRFGYQVWIGINSFCLLNSIVFIIVIIVAFIVFWHIKDYIIVFLFFCLLFLLLSSLSLLFLFLTADLFAGIVLESAGLLDTVIFITVIIDACTAANLATLIDFSDKVILLHHGW